MTFICAQRVILILIIYAKPNTIDCIQDAFFHTSKEKTEMAVTSSALVHSDIHCAWLCNSMKRCCRASYDTSTEQCLMEISDSCERRKESTDGGGRITLEKGQFRTCALPADVPHAIRKENGLDSFGDVNFGGYIKYTCVTNYFQTSGHSIRTCQSGPSWSGEAPVCEESCEIPEVIGTTQSNYGTVLSGRINVGGRIEYACKDGYSFISGDLVRICKAGSTWNGTKLLCKESCDLPPEVIGTTQLIYGTVLSGRIVVGGRIEYECKDRYNFITGDLVRTCKAGSIWSGAKLLCKEDCKRSETGYEYDGRINSTKTNKKCQRWFSDYPHSHNNNDQPENYCRNPDKTREPWCYTTDPYTRWELCDIPYCTQPAKECKETPSGVEYFGTVKTTRNGILCQKWGDTSPHSHSFTSVSDQANYCRNPYGSQASPWCYTTAAEQRWDYCDIPDC